MRFQSSQPRIPELKQIFEALDTEPAGLEELFERANTAGIPSKQRDLMIHKT